MPLMVLPFLVLMNEDRYVKKHTNGPLSNGRKMGRVDGVGGYIARWDQIDLSDPDHPRLTCPVEDLQKA